MTASHESSAPLVSVIIPARNAEDFIIDCLESVQQQSHRNLEVIVVDDGSDDDTADLVESVNDDRIRLLQTNGIGAAAARNRGAEKSAGEFLQFLDADDGLSREKISKQLASLVGTSDTVASCAWGHFVGAFAHVAVNPVPVWCESDPVRWLQRSLSGEGMMQTACWLIPRRIAELVGPWDERLSLHDDGEYFARVLMHCQRQIFVENATVYYRAVEGSLSRTRNRKAAESAFAVCQARDNLLLQREDNLNSRIALATSYAQFAYEFCRTHRDLATRSLERINALGATPTTEIGGRLFRLIAAKLGISAAIKIRMMTGT